MNNFASNSTGFPGSQLTRADSGGCSAVCGGGLADHRVQFYETDGFLVTSVASFVREGLAGEAAVLVIATREHVEALAAQLETEGVSVEDAMAEGKYVPLDAHETLRTFMVNGWPDAALFERHVASRVANLMGNGQQLYAFGEMVALLWSDGNAEAALRLEELWDGLGPRYAFSLMCAYPMRNFAHDPEGHRFQHVCRKHSRVLPAETFQPDAPTSDDQLRVIATLQQKAAALDAEISQRRRVEEARRHREAELRTLVETASIGLHWVDAEGMITWANPAELTLLGYAAEEYIGHSITEFHADQEVIQDMLRRLGVGESLKDHEARMRCKDGRIKTVLIDSTGLWEDGRFVHTQCFTRDVTEQRRAEEGNRLLAAIVESSDDAIVSKSLQGIVTSWNKGAERVFGYSAREMVGQSITKIMPPERVNEEPMILARLQRGERVDHFETVRQRKDGRLVDVSVTISPVRDGKGRITGASKIARDVTERRAVEKALEKAREELARTNQKLERHVEERTASLRDAIAQMEEFSYTVSHDLRAPLRGMRVYSQALLEDYGTVLDQEGRHCLERLVENANRLDKMVSDVLTFSRVSRMELRLEPVNMDRLVRELVQHYPEMQPPRAVITIEPLHDVIGHEPSLVQIVSNLLTNAVKFVAPGITPSIRVWTERNAQGVKLWVEDKGIGINPAQHRRLFKMFERLHPDLPYEGTGVGLAIVRKAALRMGGEVGVKSDGKTGAAFWVKLPLNEGSE